MTTALLCLMLTGAPTASDLQPGTLLTYRGNFIAEKGEPAVTEKKFKLSLLIAAAGEGRAVYWSLEEQGRGGWSWISRYGRYEVGQRLDPKSAPTLLYERPQGTSVINLLPPFLVRDEELSQGVEWKADKFNHEVVASGKTAGLDTWRVDVRNAYGLKRKLFVAKETPMVVGLFENVFIGQGEKHELSYELSSVSQLVSAQAEAAEAAFVGFIKLREELGIELSNRDVKWTEKRLIALREQLPAVAKGISDGPLVRIAQDALRDSKAQKNRAGAVAVMRERLLGNASPQPDLSELTGKKFDWTSTDNKVTVLHFWEYRDTPLEEPYGQIAYLDFLFRNKTSDDVQVIGVASNQRLLQPDTRRRAIQGVKKLKSFMNLSYHIVADVDGAIDSFGDPRVTGAKLPLYVVLDKDGKVIHHHVGTYEVNRDRGLEELDNVVKKALE